MFTNPSSHPHHNLRQLNWMQAGTLLPPPPDQCLSQRNDGFGSGLEARSNLRLYQCFRLPTLISKVSIFINVSSVQATECQELNVYQC